jgi:hypothetical protein
MSYLLTPAQESALDAAGKVLVELGIPASISFDTRFTATRPFCFTAWADFNGHYIAKSDVSLIAAVKQWMDEANRSAAAPKPLDAPAVKQAVVALVDELRRDHPDYVGPAIDELADRIAALPVKQ